jgi:hypothetical protein
MMFSESYIIAFLLRLWRFFWSVDPDLTAFEVFFLPNRHDLFDAVDGIAAGFECALAVT